MDVRCERCKAQYVFDDEQVTPSGLTVQCTNCGHLFKVKKKELVVDRRGEAGRDRWRTDARDRRRAACERARGRRAGASRASGAYGSPGGSVRTCRELTTVQNWIVEGRVARDDEILGRRRHVERGSGTSRSSRRFFRSWSRRSAAARCRSRRHALPRACCRRRRRLSTARVPAAAVRVPFAAASCARPGASAGASARAAWGTRGARRGPRGGRRDGSRVRAGGTGGSEGQGARDLRGGDRRREAAGLGRPRSRRTERPLIPRVATPPWRRSRVEGRPRPGPRPRPPSADLDPPSTCASTLDPGPGVDGSRGRSSR